MADTEDFVANSDVESARSSPAPLCGLSLLFKPRGSQASAAFSEDSMSPIIPNRFPLSGKSSSQNDSQKIQVKEADRKEEDELMFSDSESCVSEVIIPLRNSMFPPFTPQHTHTFVTSEMVDTELSKKLTQAADTAGDDGSETTAGGMYEEEGVTSKKPWIDDQTLRPGVAFDDGRPDAGDGDSQTTVGGAYTEMEENPSKKLSQQSCKSTSFSIHPEKEERELSQKKSSQGSIKLRSRTTWTTNKDSEDSGKTVQGFLQEEDKSSWKSSQGSQSLRSGRNSDAVLSPECGGSGSEKRRRLRSQRSQESLTRSSERNICDIETKNGHSQNVSKSPVDSEQKGTSENSHTKKRSGHRQNSKDQSESASIASSESSHLSDETQDPTNGQTEPEKQGNSGQSRTVEDELLPSQPVMTQQQKDASVEVSQSQSLIDPQPLPIRKRLSGLVSSSQSSGGSDRSDSKTKDKEEKLKTHHDLEVGLLEKLEKHQATAKSMASNNSATSAGKIQILLVSLAPLMEQLKKAHTNERQHIKREREKNLNPSERSLLKLQITLMLERERRLLQIYKQHTELAGQVKDLREKALREKLNSSQMSMVSQATQKQQAQPMLKPCSVAAIPTAVKKKTLKKIKGTTDSQPAMKRPMTKSIPESIPSKKTKLEASAGKPTTNPNQKSSFSPPFKPTNEKSCKEHIDGKRLSEQHDTKTTTSPARAVLPDESGNNVKDIDLSSTCSEGAETTMAVISDNESVMTFQEYDQNEDVSSNEDVPTKNRRETTEKLQSTERNHDKPAEIQMKENHEGRGRFCSMEETGEIVQNDEKMSSQVHSPKPILESEKKQFADPEIVISPTEKQPQMDIEEVVQNAIQNTGFQPSGFSSPPISAVVRDRNADNMSFGSPYSSIYGAATCPVTIPKQMKNANSSSSSQIGATRVDVNQQRNILSGNPVLGVQQQPDASGLSANQLKSYLVHPASAASEKVSKTSIPVQMVSSGKPSAVSILSQQPALKGLGVNSSIRQVGQAGQVMHIVHQAKIRPTSTVSKRQVSSSTVVTSSAVTPRGQVSSSSNVGQRQLMLPPKSKLTIQGARPFININADSQHLDVFRMNAQAVAEQPSKKQMTSQQPGLPDLGELVTAGKIVPGHRVMTLQSEGRTFHASLTEEGWIRGAGGEVFRTPMAWYKAVIPEAQKQVITKKISYPKVLYNGVPLSEYSLSPAQMGHGGKAIPHISGMNQVLPNQHHQVQTTHDMIATTSNVMTSAVTCSTSSAQEAVPPSLSSLLRCCKVALHSKQELVPHSRWLPANFWTEADFNKVDLPAALIAEVDCW